MDQTTRQAKPLAIINIGALFFISGFVGWLNGTLIPFLKPVKEYKAGMQSPTPPAGREYQS